LREAGERAKGGTAIVTLEPCNRTGLTGPCTEALLEADIARVVFAESDPTPAGGGAQRLRGAGVEVVEGIGVDEVAAINREWRLAVQLKRPFVRLKMAISLDGRVAGEQGEPCALTGTEANAYVHQLRANAQAVIVGTGTALIDDPALTVRHVGLGAAGPPTRVVVGSRTVPTEAKLHNNEAPFRQFLEESPAQVLEALYADGVREVLLEGGPTLAGAFLAAGLVDELVWLIAPVFLGTGPFAGAANAPGASLRVQHVDRLGNDVRIIATIDPVPTV
jgi:diaminohydroxyphosphoribosylaminopyrimidine deaminase/5-amino-6-(5-phosphoribosylamino)uracil reductase